MFDWDDVAEDLGGPNQAALDLEAEVAAEAEAERLLRERQRSRLCAEEDSDDVEEDMDQAAERLRRQLGVDVDEEELGEAPPPQRQAPQGPPAPQPRSSPPQASAAASQEERRREQENLKEAVKAGDLKLVMRLLQGGADPNALDMMGETPLFEAAQYGHIDVVAALLVHSADADRTSPALLLASDVASDGATRTLLDSFRAASDEAQAGDLRAALGAVGLLLRPLVTQALQAKLQAKFLASGQLMEQERAAAQRAAADRIVAKAKTAPPRGTTAQKGALKGAGKGKLSFGGYARIDAPAASSSAAPPRAEAKASAAGAQLALREAPLTLAVRQGSLREVLRLLHEGADPNLADGTGETPLFEAALVGGVAITAALLLRRADPAKRSHAGQVPFDLATSGAARGLLDFFSGAELDEERRDFLLDSLQGAGSAPLREELEAEMRARCGAEVEVIEDDDDIDWDAERERRERAADTRDLSQAPLARAVRAGDLDEVWRLLAAGADANEGDELGETPLFEAAASGFTDVTAALLLCSADPRATSLTGGSAVDLAANSANRLLVEFFQGTPLSEGEKLEVVQALGDASVRDKVTQRLRAGSMQDALKHTLRKLRA